MINRKVRNFEIKELIATGGMAAIYKAVQLSLDRIVAIKILHGHLAQDKNFITRFEREAKAAANLKHENIVNIIDYGKVEDVYFIAMEYVEGRSLKDLIVSIKFVPFDIALAIAQDISEGLDHAHQKGVVHRDVKPANILINNDGVVKITDFGLAQAQDLTSITVTGSIVGTPAYMSPEQAGGKKVDQRTDIFSLGVVVYEMITGTKPFSGENYSSVIHEILTVKPPRPVEANPLITKEVNDMIERMLEKDIDNRYQDISGVKDDISSYFQKKNIKITHKKIAEFINTPTEHFASLVQERKRKHYERGLYFMNLKSAKVNEAINEFSKVLHLDPDDVQAKRYLTKLREKKEKAVPLKKKKVPTKKKKSLVPIGVIAGVLVLVVLLVLIGKGGRKKAVLPAAQNFGAASIQSTPAKASVYVDQKNLNLMTPAYINSLVVGQHKIELKKEGYKIYANSFDIKTGETTDLNVSLEKQPAEIAYGSITVKSTPPDALVFLDGVNTGLRTPCTLKDVEEGSHKVKVAKKNYETAKVNRNVTANKTSSISVTLSKKQGPSTLQKKYSYLKINIDPWARIYIGKKYLETTPIAKPLKVPSGTHTLRLVNPNFKVWQKKVTFKPDETVSFDVKLESKEGFLKLTVKPWADVYIDGKFYETTPIAKPIKLTAGTHTLKLVNSSFKPFEQQIVVPVNKMLKKHVELVPK
jgi:serine/threonine protein kinase